MLRYLFLITIFLQFSSACFANDKTYTDARKFQHEKNYDEAIGAYLTYLSQPIISTDLTPKKIREYTDALVQLMNTYQSKGDPEGCIVALHDLFRQSPTLQQECLRDFNSVLGYALSRTERMNEAQETIFKALTLPLYSPTPERYFRDYAYAAAVFYSNPKYYNEVTNWCLEALIQAELSDNLSGKQWVQSMLGSLYKRNGNLDKAFELYQQSKQEAQSKNDDLGVLNSLHNLVDLFLYWDIPQYANIYASEAVKFENNMKLQNPMVSAQTYINKGRALYQIGQLDSISYYNEQARQICDSLPYNSGMVDVDLLNGIIMTETGDERLDSGISFLQNVARKGTVTNRAKAYHQLAQTYLKHNQNLKAEFMLDSLYQLINYNEFHPLILHIDYEPIISHYRKTRNMVKADEYVQLLLEEQRYFKENRVNTSLVGAIVDFQTDKNVQDIKISQLTLANQRLWLIILLIVTVIVILLTVLIILNQKEKITSIVNALNESDSKNKIAAQEIQEFLDVKNNRQELQTLTPVILKENGETKFRQCFDLLYPIFIHRLRERVPSITRREELVSMLIALKQDNKMIADLLGIAPRSVLMLRHRFRQKIGLNTEYSLENFIEDILSECMTTS